MKNIKYIKNWFFEFKMLNFSSLNFKILNSILYLNKNENDTIKSV